MSSGTGGAWSSGGVAAQDAGNREPAWRLRQNARGEQNKLDACCLTPGHTITFGYRAVRRGRLGRLIHDVKQRPAFTRRRASGRAASLWNIVGTFVRKSRARRAAGEARRAPR